MKKIFALLPMGLLLLASSQAQATTVNYSVSNSGGSGQYEYTITNDSLAFDIFELTIYFDHTVFASLSNPGAPAGWNPLAIGPPGFVNDDGFYDVLSLGAGIAPGATLGGFTVEFDLLSGKTPGLQFFEVVDKNNFDVLDSGFTEPSPIPVPAAVWLFGSGIAGLMVLARRRLGAR